jgi:hypothetical protein
MKTSIPLEIRPQTALSHSTWSKLISPTLPVKADLQPPFPWGVMIKGTRDITVNLVSMAVPTYFQSME